MGSLAVLNTGAILVAFMLTVCLIGMARVIVIWKYGPLGSRKG